MANDQYENMQSLSGPVSNAVPIVPDDDVDIDVVSRCVYVGSAGNLAVIMNSGQSVVFVGVNAGTFLPIRVDRVLATGTTAGDILNLY